MTTKSSLTVLAMLFLAAIDQAATAAPRGSLGSISGHGTWVLNTGDDYENHQPYIESTTIDAWLDADGVAHGTIVWMDTFNGPADSHGESYSGYTWQVDVDTYWVWSDNEVYVEGTITHSNVEGDIGFRSGFYVFDGGRGGTDFIGGYPVLKGNFKID